MGSACVSVTRVFASTAARIFVAAACLSATLLASGVVSAQSSSDQPVPDVRPERRSGFVLGLIGGLALGGASGNPDIASQRYDPAYATSTGFAAGYRIAPFFGGALTDWFTFGLGATLGSIETGARRSEVTAFVFHLEAFPLFAKGGTLRDAGVSLDFGAGVANIVSKRNNQEVATAGVASLAGIGLFWEPWRWWHFAMGPCVVYQYDWSDHFSRHDVTLGLKGMFYGGP